MTLQGDNHIVLPNGNVSIKNGVIMADRDKKTGKFLPGHGGLKKKGTKHFNGLHKLLKSKEPEILEAALQQALDGTAPQTMQYILRKMYGNAPFSDFKLAGKDALEVSRNLLAAIGNVDPQILNSASQLLQGHLKVQESADFEKRLEALEAGQ